MAVIAGAVLAVFLVDVLNHRLTAIAARQIQIDIGPLAAFLRQEALEQQLHAHRVDGGDAEAVAHGAVGRRAAALHEDVLLPAEIDDVPDDQEVAGEIEPLDQIELAHHLRAGALVKRPVAVARADLGDLAQERRLGLAVGDRIFREAITEVVHAELQPIGQFARGVHRGGAIREQPRHLRRRLEVALGVGGQAPAGSPQREVFANRGQHVEQRPLFGRGKADAAGGHQRHAKRLGEAHQRVVVVFLIALQVALQLHKNIVAAEDADQAIEQAADAEPLGAEERAAGHGNEAGDAAVELVDGQRALAFRRAQLHARNEAAEIAPPFLRCAQHRE